MVNVVPVFDKLRFDEDLEESPRLKGSRISVVQIYEMYILRGLTVEELVDKYEALDRESVEQAIRYAQSHPDLLREQGTSHLSVDVAERQNRSREAAAA